MGVGGAVVGERAPVGLTEGKSRARVVFVATPMLVESALPPPSGGPPVPKVVKVHVREGRRDPEVPDRAGMSRTGWSSTPQRTAQSDRTAEADAPTADGVLEEAETAEGVLRSIKHLSSLFPSFGNFNASLSFEGHAALHELTLVRKVGQYAMCILMGIDHGNCESSVKNSQ